MKKITAILLILVMGMGLFACYDSTISPSSPLFTTTAGLGTTTRPTTTRPTTTRPTTTRPTTTPGTSVTTRPNTGTTSTTVTTRPSGTTTTTGSVTTPNIPKEDPDLSGFDRDELALFDELFNHENHVSLYLDISQSELKKINEDYGKYKNICQHGNHDNGKSPIYRMADLYVTITKPNGEKLEYYIEQVGVRMKGNTSRTYFWDSSSGMYNLVHFKISFQETFDDPAYYGNDALVWADDNARKARKNRTFATLEKIDMRWNKNDDPTYIREQYSYDIYREFGVLAPHTNLASVDIANDHAGVWMFYEPIDKIFLEKNLSPEALGGDLYKLGWTDTGAFFNTFASYGVENEDEGKFYVYDLKTNKKTSDHSSLKNLINTINSNSCNKNSFSSVVDVENFLMFAAVSYMMGNPDDLRNNYNNCYIYFRADNGKMMIIPYDVDRGLGVNKHWNPSGNHMTNDSPFGDTAIGNGNSKQKNPLFTKGILNANFFKNEYVEALRVVASSDMFKISNFEESFNIAKNLYGSDATPSKQYGNAWDYSFSFDINKSDGSNMSFANYITKKTQTLAKYISDYTPDVGEGSGGNTGDNSGGNQGGTTVVKEWELYIRGNFDNNNWENHSQYKMQHIGNGIYSVTLTANYSSGDAGTFKFKIYNNKQSGDPAWYNTVDESKVNTSFEYQGGNKNVQLSLGTYTIYFDTNTQTIYFEKK